MQFNIEVLAVTVETKPTAKGSYQQLDVAFKKDGKTDGKKIMSFTNKEVFNTLQNAKAGDVFTVTSQKNEKSGYWDWVGVTKGGDAVGGNNFTVKATPTPKNTYETAEERAKKQVYIVRQSSISAAVETLKTDKKALDPKEVIEVAKLYEAYVFDIQAEVDITMEDDDVPL